MIKFEHSVYLRLYHDVMQPIRVQWSEQVVTYIYNRVLWEFCQAGPRRPGIVFTGVEMKLIVAEAEL